MEPHKVYVALPGMQGMCGTMTDLTSHSGRGHGIAPQLSDSLHLKAGHALPR